MLDLDKDWIPVILAVVGPLLVGIGWWFKARREDRLNAELERKKDKAADLAEIARLQKVIFDMQQGRIEDESNKRREVDTTVKLMTDMATLLKSALAEKEKA